MATPLVLVVDDGGMFGDLLRPSLEVEGYRVAVAPSGEAPSVAKKLRPAVVVVDMTLPDMGVRAACGRLRDDPATSTVPIIALSGRRDIANYTADVPIDDRLKEPFRLDELYAMMARWTKPAQNVGGRPSQRSTR